MTVPCRFYFPIMDSVQPDGNWYLVVSEEYSGRWAPVNYFMNGDVVGGPTEHNTDMNVPECT